jgi:hypothetical protein
MVCARSLADLVLSRQFAMLLPSCAKCYLIEVEMEEKRKLVILGGEEESDDTCKRRRNRYLEEKRKLMFVEREKEAYSWKQSCFSQEVSFSVLWISVHCSP